MGDVTLRYLLFGEDKTASKTIKHVGREADSTAGRIDGFAGRVGASVGSMGRVVGAAAIGVAAAAGTAAIAGASIGIQTAAGLEQARIAFTTMLGSGEKADAFLRDLADFAAKTPFEFPELQSAASSLISAGFATEKVIPMMRTLGDVTSGMGTGSEGVKRATVALQQMSAAGRITGEDLNQLRDAGVPVFDLLAAATGRSKEAIADMAAKGKLGKTEMEALFRALETGKGLERFSGLMDKQSQSLTGLWSTAKDVLGMGLAQLIEPLIPLLKDGLGGATTFVTAALPKLKQGFQDAWGWIQKHVVPVAREVWAWLSEKLFPAVQKVAAAVGEGLTNAWGTVQEAIESNRPALETVWGWLRNVADVVSTKVVPVLGPILKGVLSALGMAFGAVVTIIGGVVTALQTVGKWGIWLWNNALAPTIRFILNGFAGLTGGIAAFLRALSNIPGFGWAADAAAKMDAAADQARRLATQIENIPDSHTVTIVWDARTTAAFRALNAQRATRWQNDTVDQRAAGGPVDPFVPYLVGERGPEIVQFSTGGYVHDAQASRTMMRNVAASAPSSSAPAMVHTTVVLDGRVLLESVAQADRRLGTRLLARA